MSNASTPVSPVSVASEAIRIRPLLANLEEDNIDLLRDIVDNLSDDELANAYTSGDKTLLHRRISNVLIMRLGFARDSLTFDQIREVLSSALPAEKKSA